MIGRCWLAPYLKIERDIDIKIHLIVYHRAYRGRGIRSRSRTIKTFLKREGGSRDR